MVSRYSFWRLCSIKNMFYTLLLISLCAVLHVWMLDVITLDFTDSMRSALSAVSIFRPKFEFDAETKVILSWRHSYLTSNVTNKFPALNCSTKNCVFTADVDYLTYITAYDAIVFDHESLTSKNRPAARGASQIYVFMSKEPFNEYPACELFNDDFYNWTFTYRLDSDVLWRYFVVRDVTGKIVAPSREVIWTESENPPTLEIKSILQRKNKAVVWLVGHCSAESYEYMQRLEKHLYHFGLRLEKHRHYALKSDDNLTKNYKFILAFEDSIAEDYVTEKVIDGLRNYAVPVVYGGANYSRFLPPGSYIDASAIHPYNLAHGIHEASKNQSMFENFFKWTNVYSIEEWGTKTHTSLCDLCAALHEDRAKDAPAKKLFRVWWNSPHSMHLCLPTEYLEKHLLKHSDNFTIIL